MARETVITPTTWTPRGEVEVEVRGKPLRIWQGIVGEPARVKIVHEGQNLDYGVFRDTREPHPFRVDPPCDRFHTCGGCPWMHLADEGQAKARRWMVKQALAEEGLTDVEVGELVPSPDGTHDFRWVTKLGVGWSDRGSLRVGAWGRRDRSIVPIPECVVAAPPVRLAMTAIAHHTIDLDIAPYDPEIDKGVLRAFVIRGSRTTGEVLVTIVAGRRTGKVKELAERLIQQASEITGVALHLNSEPGNAIFVRDEEGAVPWMPLEGNPWIEETLNGVTYRVGPGDFFQTNPGTAEVLYRDTIERLGLEEDVPFVDLYCGVGGLALPAARRTGWALGVEEVAGAVDKARDAARTQDIPAEFMAGRVEELLPTLARRLAAARPVVAVNPARRGLEPGVVEGIAALRPRRMAYISCNPRALARDLVLLRKQGMQVGSIALYDMFPNTPHVECVAVLTSDVEPDSDRRAPRRRMVGTRRSPTS